MRLPHRQRGSTLLVGMIMLVLLTLLAVSSIESTTSSLQIVGNAQFRQEASAAAQQAIENVISTTTFTTTPPPQQTIDINNDGTPDYTVSFSAPKCNKYIVVDPATELKKLPISCYGSSGTILCYRTTWDISAVVSDVTTGTTGATTGTTGATLTLHQGIKLLVGLNAALSSCGV